MKRAAGSAGAVLRGILFIGFSIQILFGIAWMCANLFRAQEFQGSWGSLYRAACSLTGRQRWILYAVQLSAGGYAAHRFLGRIRRVDAWWDVWRCLAMLAFPPAMQCHLAISPYSLVSSLFLLELSAVLPEKKKRSGEAAGDRTSGLAGKLARGGLCWFFLTLLLPEYFLLGAAPLLLGLLSELPSLRGRLRRFFGCVLLLAAFGGMIAGTCVLTEGGGYLPNREKAAFALFHRVSWPSLWADHEDWPEEVRLVTEKDVWNASLHADDPERILRPVMLEEFGAERAAGYYLELAKISWEEHRSWTIRQIGWDVLGYGVTPLILPRQLEGMGYASYSGRNYELMFMHTPRLTKAYVNYGCWWFAVMLPTSALLGLALAFEEPKRWKGWRLTPLLLCLLWAGLVTAAYTMRGAGRMDYKCSVGVNLLWLAAALLLCGGRRTDGKTGRADLTDE